MSFDIALIADSIPKMLAGFAMTFQLWLLSAVLGLALAVILLIMRISGRWYLAAPTMVYIYIFRGTPILVQIFIIYTACRSSNLSARVSCGLSSESPSAVPSLLSR